MTEKEAVNLLKEDAGNIINIPSDLLNQELVNIVIDEADKDKNGNLLLLLLEKVPRQFIPGKVIGWLIEHVKIGRHNEKLTHTFEGRLDGGISAADLVRLAGNISSEFWTDELTVICHDVIKTGGYGSYLKYVPAQRMTQAMCADALNTCAISLEYVPNQFKTKDMCLKVSQAAFATSDFFRILKWIPKEYMSEELEQLCIEKIKDKGNFSSFTSIPKELRLPSISLFAVKHSWKLLNDVPEEYRNKEIYFEAVSQNSNILKQVPNELKTMEMCLAGIKQDGWLLKNDIPDALKTEEICLEAVKHNGDLLEYVPEKFRTAQVCLEAVQKTGRAYDLIPESIRTPQMLETAKKNLYIEKVSAEQINTKEKYEAALADQTKYMPQETQDLLKEHSRTEVKPEESGAIEQHKKTVEELLSVIYSDPAQQAVRKIVMNTFINNPGCGRLDYWEGIVKSLEEQRTSMGK